MAFGFLKSRYILLYTALACGVGCVASNDIDGAAPSVEVAVAAQPQLRSMNSMLVEAITYGHPWAKKGQLERIEPDFAKAAGLRTYWEAHMSDVRPYSGRKSPLPTDKRFDERGSALEHAKQEFDEVGFEHNDLWVFQVMEGGVPKWIVTPYPHAPPRNGALDGDIVRLSRKSGTIYQALGSGLSNMRNFFKNRNAYIEQKIFSREEFLAALPKIKAEIPRHFNKNGVVPFLKYRFALAASDPAAGADLKRRLDANATQTLTFANTAEAFAAAGSLAIHLAGAGQGSRPAVDTHARLDLSIPVVHLVQEGDGWSVDLANKKYFAQRVNRFRVQFDPMLGVAVFVKSGTAVDGIVADLIANTHRQVSLEQDMYAGGGYAALQLNRAVFGYARGGDFQLTTDLASIPEGKKYTRFLYSSGLQMVQTKSDIAKAPRPPQ